MLTEVSWNEVNEVESYVRNFGFISTEVLVKKWKQIKFPIKKRDVIPSSPESNDSLLISFFLFLLIGEMSCSRRSIFNWASLSFSSSSVTSPECRHKCWINAFKTYLHSKVVFIDLERNYRIILQSDVDNLLG